MDYGELVKSAFWVSLRNRYLWFFGFFVGSGLSNLSGSAVAALILIPLLLMASGAVGTFNHAYWTLAYLRLAPGYATPDPQPAV